MYAVLKKEMTQFAEKLKEFDLLTFLAKLFPFLTYMRVYSLKTFRGDIIAGITCGLLIIPQGIAYANLAGLPGEFGLYTAMTPGILYFIFGTSKDVSLGPTVTMALFTNRFNSTHSPIGGSALAFLVGAVLFAMAILRLGFITKFMPMHVNSGFVSAAAIVVAVSQLKNLFGLTTTPSDFIGKLKHFVTNVKDTHKFDLYLGAGSIAVLILFMFLSGNPLKKLQRKEGSIWKVFANSLWFACIARSGIICIMGTVISYLVANYGGGQLFTLAGNLPSGLPSFQSPFADAVIPESNITMTFLDFTKSFSSGLIVLPIIQFVQSISIAKAFGKIYQYEIDSTQELIALSCANMFGAFFGGWPVTGSFSGSAVNAMSGTQTPFSSVIACGLVFVAVGFLMPCFFYIPKTVLGAMIVMAVVTMIDIKTPMRIWKVKKIDLIPYFVAFFGTFYTLESGVLAGAVVSLVIMVSYETSPAYELVNHPDGASITIIFKGNLSYPSVEYVKDTINSHVDEHEGLRSVTIDMGYVYNIDYAVVNSFRTIISELESARIVVDFVNFIDDKVEESFKRGKLERECLDKEDECSGEEEEEKDSFIDKPDDSIYINQARRDSEMNPNDVLTAVSNSINKYIAKHLNNDTVITMDDISNEIIADNV